MLKGYHKLCDVTHMKETQSHVSCTYDCFAMETTPEMCYAWNGTNYIEQWCTIQLLFLLQKYLLF